MDEERSERRASADREASADFVDVDGDMTIRLPVSREPWPMLVLSTRRMTAWRLRSDRIEDRIGALHEETTVVYEDTAYQVRSEHWDGKAWVYGMAELPDHERRFNVVDLSPSARIRARAEEAAARRESRAESVSFLIEAVFGFFPAREQNRLAERFGFDPPDATRRTALIEITLALLTIPAFVIYAFIVGKPNTALITIFLLGDGMFRWSYALTHEEPFGMVPVEILDRYFFSRMERFFGGGADAAAAGGDDPDGTEPDEAE